MYHVVWAVEQIRNEFTTWISFSQRHSSHNTISIILFRVTTNIKMVQVEAHSERMARLRWHGRGVFPPLDSFQNEDADDCNDPLPIKSPPGCNDETKISPDLLRRELKTLITGGDKVTAIDYAMKWKNFRKKEAPSTTHEITFDTKNGFDEDYVYVSGMTVNMIARVNKKDPTKQVLFRFPSNKNGREAQPHTLRFANVKSDDLKGKLWVGLEEQGQIVQLNMNKILKDKNIGINEDKPIELSKCDFETIYDVRIKGDSVPTPINTRPHGFCFDAANEYIWFTGKLTNTVGRIKVDGSPESLQHFELPTLGSVPIYVALGPDNNVWGTCLSSSTIFRVTTGTHPVVDEMSISDVAKDRRPIAIKPDPRGLPFMWFSNEVGHSVCRLDTRAFEKEVSKLSAQEKTGKCTCSTGCKYVFRGSAFVHKIITEFPIPKVNHQMKLGGLAITKEGAIWTQSYMEPTENVIDNLPDYILKLGFDKHDPTSTYDPKRSSVVNMTGVPIDYFELPTKDTVLHRITVAPDEDESVWFTELQSDRLGTITFEQRNFNSTTKYEMEDDVQEEGDSRKRART